MMHFASKNNKGPLNTHVHLPVYRRRYRQKSAFIKERVLPLDAFSNIQMRILVNGNNV